ncbi:MAG TPA: long-chain fatty acid--CoA ligase [Pyrinomonadaceae bacterium]|nr:long-chain fatty acid--CoA ligase [Pyrinomonadaceae bacterium]
MSLKPQVSNSKPRIKLFADEPNTLGELFLQAAKKHPRKDTLNYKKDGKWQSISVTEVVTKAENIGLGLHSLEIKKGDRVAILAANSPNWTLTDAGCQLVGIIDVPIYTTLAPNSIEYIINDSGAKVFFLQDKATYDRIAEILPNCKTLEKIVFFDAQGISADIGISLSELEKKGEKLKAENPNLITDLTTAIDKNDIATLIYTSGTTGEPKGVMLSHQNLISNLIDAGENFSFSEKDKALSVLPLSHVFERNGMYLYIFNGMAVYYAESIEKIVDNLQEIRPTVFVGVPRIFEKVYAKAKLKASQASKFKEKIFDWAIEVGKIYAKKIEHGENVSRFLAIKHNLADRIVFSKFRTVFGGNLRFCITGGAALSDNIFYIFNGANIKIMQGYGLTETSPVIASNNPINVRVGTVGKPIRNVEVRLAEDGEIEVTGPNIMLGYFNKPEATKDTFSADGWFKTGDIGRFDEDGFLKITDRKKELFKTSGGKYIAPAPIEQMIKGSQYVNQVVLVGNDRKFPAALIVPNFEPLESYAKQHKLNCKTLAEICQNSSIIKLLEEQVNELTPTLAKFEKVKKIALLENELTVEGGELTPTLKVKRRVVDEKYHEIIEKIYTNAEKK